MMLLMLLLLLMMMILSVVFAGDDVLVVVSMVESRRCALILRGNKRLMVALANSCRIAVLEVQEGLALEVLVERSIVVVHKMSRVVAVIRRLVHRVCTVGGGGGGGRARIAMQEAGIHYVRSCGSSRRRPWIVIDAVDIFVAQVEQISAIALQVEQALTRAATEALLVVFVAHDRTERLERIGMFEAALAIERVGLFVETLHDYCAARSEEFSVNADRCRAEVVERRGRSRRRHDLRRASLVLHERFTQFVCSLLHKSQSSASACKLKAYFICV